LGVVFTAGCVGGGIDNPLGESESALTSGPDLIESAVGDPPTAGVPGDTFTMTDTVTNQGTVDAASTFTKYYLSSDGVTLQFLLGNRAVGAIVAGGTDSGMATVKIPGGAHGTYKVVACADSGPGAGGRTSQVAETNENNNCTASAGSIVVTAPDLTETSVTTSPPSVDVSFGVLSITDTVHNGGDADAGASTTRWFLSADNVFDASDAFIRNCTNGGPIPGRAVNPIPAGMSDTGVGTDSPLCIRDSAGLHPPAVGTYWVVACADNAQQVLESNENNNCAVASNSVLVTKCGNSVIEGAETCDDGNTNGGDGCSATCQIEGNSDLTVTAVGNPPATASVGGTMTVSDTVANISTNGAPASQTYYFLSADRTYSTNDRLLTGSRAVPPVNAGTSNSGSTTVTIPTGTTAGPWYLLACADGPNTVPESNETNNCLGSTTQVTIQGPDLVVSAVGNPPATGNVGTAFNITDTTSNIGTGASPSTYTKFYLSHDGSFLDYYLGVRQVSALNGGAAQSATTSVTIRTGTLSGSYKVVACADAGPGTGGRTSEVAETNENNNCTASATFIQVGSPDLVVTSVGNPPANLSVGQTYAISDVTSNVGQGDSPSFFNKYYLSTDGVTLQYYTGTASAGALAAGASEPVTTTGTIRTGTAPGSYFLISCADSGPGISGRTSQVPESNEKNNCTASATKVQVN